MGNQITNKEDWQLLKYGTMAKINNIQKEFHDYLKKYLKESANKEYANMSKLSEEDNIVIEVSPIKTNDLYINEAKINWAALGECNKATSYLFANMLIIAVNYCQEINDVIGKYNNSVYHWQHR